MADQKINELPTKSSPSTGDKVLMIGTAEEYQMLVDDLATAVLDKLTSKSYTLDQGTKTLIAALNELNSNTIPNSVGTAIPQYTDINEYTSPGTHNCADVSIKNTLSGTPSDLSSGFRLDIIRKTNGRSMQILFPNTPDVFYIRGMMNTSTGYSFEEWKKFSGVSV